MTLELTITLLLALLFSAGRAHAQAGTFLDPGVGPQPTTGFRVSVATPPITASFTFSPSSGAWPLTVQFVDTTQGGPASWLWNFGDGSTDTSQNPIHIFQSPSNTWTIQLTATGPGGSDSVSHSLTTTNPTTFRLLSNVANTFSYRIVRSPNGFRSFIIQPPYPHVAQLFSYDTIGHTNYSDLTNTDNNSIGIESSLCFLPNNRMLVLHNFAVSTPDVQEYDLLTNGYGMPTQTVYATTSPSIGAFGTANGAIVSLSNGGAAVFGSGANQFFHVAYRRPSGIWTNMPDIDNTHIEGWNNALPTAIQAAEHPDGNSVWMIVQGDFSGWIWGAKFQATTTALNLLQTNIITDISSTNGVLVYGELAPYAERVWPHAVSDWTNGHRIILSYGNFSVETDPHYPNFSTLRCAFTTLSNNFGVFPAWVQDNNVQSYDSPSVSLPQSSPGVINMTWRPWNTNFYANGIFPISQQDTSGSTSNFVDYVAQFNVWLVDDYSRDIAYRNQFSSIWFLKIKQ